jgi:hypothetical protein
MIILWIVAPIALAIGVIIVDLAAVYYDDLSGPH